MTTVSDHRKREQAVRDAYDRHAARITTAGYRTNSVYVSSKALCDWRPLDSLNLEAARVLNIGCAEPIDELHFAERIAHWTAIDVNQSIVKTARAIFVSLAHPDVARNVSFSVMDARTLGFDDASFDWVVSYSTIEHIPQERDRQRVFEEIRRVLKPAGQAIITVPNRLSSFRYTHYRNTRLGITDYGYSHLYSARELRKCLERAGLKPSVFTSDLLGAMSLVSYWPAWLYRLVRPFGRFADRIGWVCRRS